MKAEELMIGDKIRITDAETNVQSQKGVCATVRMIEKEGGYWKIIVRPDNCKYDYAIEREEEFEPIPLTPGILEKNGFKPLEEDSYIYEPLNKNNDYSIVIDMLVPFLSYIVKDSMPKSRYGGEIKFVHQLQHKIRECGISKEIIL